MSSHFAGAVVWKKEGDEIWLLIQGSRNTQIGFSRDLEIKFPGGTNRECLDESSLDTFARELKEEVGLTLGRFCPKEVHRFSEGEHEKVFYLIPFESLQGSIRTSEIMDGGTELKVPEWVKASEVGRILHASHQGALLSTLEHFGLKG